MTVKNAYVPKKGTAFRVERFTHKAFAPYARAIGEAALAWNALQADMGSMFYMLLGSDKGREATAIWNVLESGRLQRKMLRELAKATLLKRDSADGVQQRKVADIEWLIAQADNVSESRNNAIHSPLWARTDIADQTVTLVWPDDAGLQSPGAEACCQTRCS